MTGKEALNNAKPLFGRNVLPRSMHRNQNKTRWEESPRRWVADTEILNVIAVGRWLIETEPFILFILAWRSTLARRTWSLEISEALTIRKKRKDEKRRNYEEIPHAVLNLSLCFNPMTSDAASAPRDMWWTLRRSGSGVTAPGWLGDLFSSSQWRSS